MTALNAARAAPDSALLDRLLAISKAAALEEMASGIAHELNQPLGAITTFAQAGERMLARGDTSIDDAREVFQLISKEALAAADGIRRMRKLFNRDNPAKEPSSIAEVVTELAPVLELLGEPMGARLVLDITDPLPVVDIDRLRIQHVLFTLTQNAFDADRSGDATVRIAVRGNPYGVEVSVIDSGSGVASTQRAQLFHPFFTTKTQGTGLGLASARAIIEAHEGSIGYDNNEGGGSRFWFQLPTATTDT